MHRILPRGSLRLLLARRTRGGACGRGGLYAQADHRCRTSAAPTTNEPTKGGTLTYYVGEPSYIDPYNTQESEGTQVEQAIFDSLTAFDPLQPEKIVPAAAAVVGGQRQRQGLDVQAEPGRQVRRRHAGHGAGLHLRVEPHRQHQDEEHLDRTSPIRRS